ncbi:hypothetical protein BKA62DRAFT_829680 [Auriculariales sp. MPI-PUGE-AT-0066]|nr:hypothetical protein BKA62DRAFT_829680 [Auriculariales sp. MPI-PUGE-AT-0066]
MASRFGSLLALSALASYAAAVVQTVTVGLNEVDGKQGNGFDPSFIVAQPGDDIEFTFAMNQWVKDPITVQHTATRTVDLWFPMLTAGSGFDTGIHDTGSVLTNTGESFTLRVNDTNPLWFFCAVGNHCQQGMVFAVNPPQTGDGSMEKFLENAKAATKVDYTPGGTSPASSDASGSSQAPTGSDNASTPTPSTTPSGAAGSVARRPVL